MSDLESGLKEAVAEAQARGPRKGREADIVRGAHSQYIEGSVYAGHIKGEDAREFTHRETEIVSSRTNGADKRPALTAPQVIETILELTKQAREIDALMYELSDALAGGSDSPQVNLDSPGNEPAMSIFDRMGLGLLELTRALESVDRNVKRSLGAVKS
jgi:hypothetical protein